MLKPIIVGIVRFCTWAAWPVTILAAALCVGSAMYAARNFAITSDRRGRAGADAGIDQARR